MMPTVRVRGRRRTSSALLERPLLVKSPEGPLLVHPVDVEPSPLRTRMEEFVRRGYRARFDAEVASFFPWLLGAIDASDTLRAVIGFRAGGVKPLFLEQYLDTTIEDAVSRVVGRPIRRDQILEVGNLATDPATLAPAFFQAFLVSATSITRCDWLVFTGTRSVRLMLARLGAEMLEIAIARPERLQENADAWGAYYEHEPRVMAVSLATLLELLDADLFDPAQLKAWIDHGLELRR
jgi:hypothetical protein